MTRPSASCAAWPLGCTRLGRDRGRIWSPSRSGSTSWSRRHGPTAASSFACAEAARALLAEPHEVGVLHGDLRHGNVLDFGHAAGWRSTPSALWASVASTSPTSSPTRAWPTRPGPTGGHQPDRLVRRVGIMAEAEGLERWRLLLWVLAWTGLSAAWFLTDGDSARTDLLVAELAAAELDR
uniref:aminoglycoside phosphotransferase family protein n=1 Tax=Sabulicella rubraurantiaca TaxID=2811429 RepID=UPI0022A8255D|nr:aminoglycoside phosphotransferase family protein [Sabulicella rubraurantiaca]